MIILIDDIIQESNASKELKSPSLADTSTVQNLTIDFGSIKEYDCIGLGNTEATAIEVNGASVTLSTTDKNGLYLLPQKVNSSSVNLNLIGATDVGRIALGKSRSLGASPAREPGFWSTSKPRTTLSGQTIAGVGGVTGREIQVDFRYKFTEDIYRDIERAFPLQIGRGYPFFLSFEDCSSESRYPFKRFYGTTDINWLFQSSVNRFLYSKKLKFREAF